MPDISFNHYCTLITNYKDKPKQLILKNGSLVSLVLRLYFLRQNKKYGKFV